MVRIRCLVKARLESTIYPRDEYQHQILKKITSFVPTKSQVYSCSGYLSIVDDGSHMSGEYLELERISEDKYVMSGRERGVS